MSRFTTFLIPLFLAATLCGCGGDSVTDSTSPAIVRGVIQEKLASGEIAVIPNTTVIAYEWYGDSEQITSGEEVARTKTDADGKFSMSLPPGWHMIASAWPDKYAGGCNTPSPIYVERLGAGKTYNTIITQTGCREHRE